MEEYSDTEKEDFDDSDSNTKRIVKRPMPNTQSTYYEQEMLKKKRKVIPSRSTPLATATPPRPPPTKQPPTSTDTQLPPTQPELTPTQPQLHPTQPKPLSTPANTSFTNDYHILDYPTMWSQINTPLELDERTHQQNFVINDNGFLSIPQTPTVISENNFQSLLSNQSLIIDALDQLNIAVGQLHAKLDKIATYQLVNSDTVEVPTHTKEFAVIDNVQDLNEMENNLEDAEFKESLGNYLLGLFGMNGEHVNEGYNCCFTIIDKLFTRILLTKCSWSGASRSKTAKIPFKKFKNVFKLILFVVKQADPNFTADALEKFLKTQLRNSTRRASSIARSTTRRSATKRRPKIGPYSRKINPTMENVDQNGPDSDIICATSDEDFTAD